MFCLFTNQRFICAAFSLSIVGLTVIAAMPLDAQPTQKSTLCQFTAGPRRGETQDYAPRDPIPVGSACNDGAGSTGKVIAGSGGNDSSQKSTLCQFTAGPRRGETQDYAPRDPIPVGSACNDGAGSTGRVIAAKGGGSGGNGSGQKSTLCQFTAGPRKGETQDYAPRDPIPVGSACNDGAGSTGRVIAPRN